MMEEREHKHGDFAEGQEDAEGDHEDEHTGSFAEGQAAKHEHGGAHGGDFAEGQESSEEHEHSQNRGNKENWQQPPLSRLAQEAQIFRDKVVSRRAALQRKGLV